MREVKFQSNGHKLVGTYVCPAGGASKVLLRLSGGANIGYSPNKWQARLAERGISSFAFDFVGVDKSEGELRDTNLLTRLEDSRQAYKKFRELIGDNLPITVFGVSMSAPTAIQIASECKVAGLILTVAAAYPANSHDKNFGEAFSKVIRVEGAWQDAVEFDKLSELDLPLLFVTALKDEVIPHGITKRYEAIVSGKGGKVIHFDVPHPFLREYDDEYIREITEFWKAVGDFVIKTA